MTNKEDIHKRVMLLPRTTGIPFKMWVSLDKPKKHNVTIMTRKDSLVDRDRYRILRWFAMNQKNFDRYFNGEFDKTILLRKLYRYY